jgi:hypothetical protein
VYQWGCKPGLNMYGHLAQNKTRSSLLTYIVVYNNQLQKPISNLYYFKEKPF